MKIGTVESVGGVLYPKVSFDAFDLEGESHAYIATLDTGFSGWIALPAGEIDRLRLPFFRTAKVTLADASEINAGIYIAEVFFTDRISKVLVLAIGSVPLVGTSLLANASINLDMFPNGEVTYSAISA